MSSSKERGLPVSTSTTFTSVSGNGMPILALLSTPCKPFLFFDCLAIKEMIFINMEPNLLYPINLENALVKAAFTGLNCTVFMKPVSYTHLRAHETRHDLVCR